MNTIGENIRRLRKSHKYTQKDLAELLGVKPTTVASWEQGRNKPLMDKVTKLSNLFEISPTELIGKSLTEKTSQSNLGPTNIHPISKNIVKVPLIGSIAMGAPITAEENIESYDAIELQYDIPADELFELECEGHSMEPTIPNGAIGLFEVTSTVEDGEIAAVQVDHDSEATLKRIQHDKGQILLKPDNPNYPTLTIDKDHPGRIVGRLLEYKVKMHKK